MKKLAILILALASATATASHAADLNAVAVRGRLITLHFVSASGFGEFRAYATILLPRGTEIYDVPVQCPSVIDCHALESQFACTPQSTWSVDPTDPSLTIERKECATFTWNHCVAGIGHLQNVAADSHYAQVVADEIEPAKDFNCTAVEG